jgi:ATP-dependent exoDNAse (exonuclease V) alpha subunit
VHEELALPDQIAGLAARSRSTGRASPAPARRLWNAVDTFEKRADAQLAREMIIALPEELTRAENIALVREFVRGQSDVTGHGRRLGLSRQGRQSAYPPDDHAAASDR